jgi:phage baseplate assembly protein W
VEQIYEKTISYPFTFDAQGNVATTTDQSKIWQDRVLAVLGTNLGERVQRLDFGSEIYKKQFETSDVAISEIEKLVAVAFNSQLPLLSLNSVNGVFDSSSGTVTIEVSYMLPNRTLVSTQMSTVVIINGNTPPKEI